MKRFLNILCALAAFIAVHAQDTSRLNVKAGIQAPYTLDATIGYEMPVGNGNAIEIFGEAGNHWQTPVCHRFWKGHYWDGGFAYKKQVRQYKNGNLRLTGGVYVGSDKGNVFFGAELGLEYNYVFSNNWVFTVTEKNNFNFLHGDLFRNGLMVGVKIPM